MQYVNRRRRNPPAVFVSAFFWTLCSAYIFHGESAEDIKNL